jgi:hypothetical protein
METLYRIKISEGGKWRGRAVEGGVQPLPLEDATAQPEQAKIFLWNMVGAKVLTGSAALRVRVTILLVRSSDADRVLVCQTQNLINT